MFSEQKPVDAFNQNILEVVFSGSPTERAITFIQWSAEIHRMALHPNIIKKGDKIVGEITQRKIIHQKNFIVKVLRSNHPNQIDVARAKSLVKFMMGTHERSRDQSLRQLDKTPHELYSTTNLRTQLRIIEEYNNVLKVIESIK